MAGSSAGAPVALAGALLVAAHDPGLPNPDPQGLKLRGPPDLCSIALISPAAVPDVPRARLHELAVPLSIAVEAGSPRYLDTARELARLAPAAAAQGTQVEVAGTTDHSSGLVENHPEALDLLVTATRACG